MMIEIDWSHIGRHIIAASGRAFSIKNISPVAGGSINQAWHVEGVDASYFVKLNDLQFLAMFTAELEGIEEMAATETIRVPMPLCVGTTASHAYIVLEYLGLNQAVDDRSSEQLGEQLAALHRHSATHFGWHQDNTIGTTLQINTRSQSWSKFWAQHRLGFQLDLASRNGHKGHLQQRGQQLLTVIDQLMMGHACPPSLLHGDLWSGNVATIAAGCAVIFDPAVYYGDRETDVAMTELFGGFSPRFYHAYQSVWPLDAGYQVRKVLYNLYHILNHLNLFGGSYRRQAEGMIDQLLAELG